MALPSFTFHELTDDAVGLAVGRLEQQATSDVSVRNRQLAARIACDILSAALRAHPVPACPPVEWRT